MRLDQNQKKQGSSQNLENNFEDGDKEDNMNERSMNSSLKLEKQPSLYEVLKKRVEFLPFSKAIIHLTEI